MTKLPSAAALPVLTESNIISVAETYLKNLTGPDAERGRQFILTALRRAQRDARNSWSDYDGAVADLRKILPFTHSVRIKYTERIDEITEWLLQQGVEYHMTNLLGYVFIFRNPDDALLFKLKWYT